MQVDKFNVTLDFVNRVHGGIPVVEESLSIEERADRYDGWIGQQVKLSGAHADEVESARMDLAVALADDETMPTSEEAEEIPLNGFRRLNNVPVLERRQVKAMLKEAAQRLGYIEKTRGTRQVLQHDLVVRPIDGNGDYLPLGVRDISGIEQRPIHVNTPQGPRSALAANEYVEGAVTTFQIWILKGGVGDGKLDEEKLREMLEYAEVFGGLGANRSAGYGRFTVRSIERV